MWNKVLKKIKKSNSGFSPTSAIDKTLIPVEKVKGNTNVPWLSTPFIFMTVTWLLTTLIGSVVLSLQNWATNYVPERKTI